jgi:hypothetical protein
MNAPVRNMEIEDIDRELAAAGYIYKPQDNNHISIEELLCEI